LIPPSLENFFKNIHAILFDAEGVVIDTEPLWDKSQELLMKELGLVYDRSRLKPAMAGKTILEGVMVMKRMYGIGGEASVLADRRARLIGQLFEEDIHWVDGFKDFFEEIKRRGLDYCIATSMERHLMDKVNNKLHVNQLFRDQVYHISDVGHRSKPNPDIFLYAADQLGVSKESCVVIEDSPLGILAAKRANMKCIGLATTFEEALLTKADVIAKSYTDVIEILN